MEIVPGLPYRFRAIKDRLGKFLPVKQAAKVKRIIKALRILPSELEECRKIIKQQREDDNEGVLEYTASKINNIALVLEELGEYGGSWQDFAFSSMGDDLRAVMPAVLESIQKSKRWKKTTYTRYEEAVRELRGALKQLIMHPLNAVQL
jgi:hypothetical protein